MITLKDGTQINFNTPEDNYTEETKLEVQFSKQFKEQDVEISIKVNGEATNLKSGNHEVGFSISKGF